MKFHRFLIGLCILLTCLALSLSVSAQAAPPDETPTPEGTEIVEDATEAVTDEVAAPVENITPEATPDVTVILVEQPPLDNPTTVVNNNGFSFTELVVTVLGFILTIFAGIRMFVVPVLKSNHELAVAAGNYVPQATFDRVIGVTEGLQRWAETLTPSFKGDEEGLKLIRKEVDDLKLLFHPLTGAVTVEGGSKPIDDNGKSLAERLEEARTNRG